MKKFYNVQRILCVIPFFSSIIIFTCTFVELIRTKARGKHWVCFVLAMVGIHLLTWVIGPLLIWSNFEIACFIFMLLLYTVANFVFIGLQKTCWELAERAADELPPYFVPLTSGVLGVALLVVLAGFSFMLPGGGGDHHIPDTNGPENTSLCSIETDMIVAERDTYAASGYRTSYSGNKTSVEGDLEECDRDNSKLSIKKLSGVMTVQATRIGNRTLTLDIESTIDSGNLEIFILVDGEIYDVIPAGESVRVKLEDIGGKLVCVRVAGENADFSVEVNRKYGLRD